MSDVCPSYTFDSESFGMEPVIYNVTLVEGNSCYITINRTIDGSYGTVSVKTEDPYLLIFDEDVLEYTSKATSNTVAARGARTTVLYFRFPVHVVPGVNVL